MLLPVTMGLPRSSPVALMLKRSVTDEPSVPAGTVQQEASCSRSVCQFPTLGLPALHEGASSAGRALVERLFGSWRSTSLRAGATRTRGERSDERRGASDGSSCDAPAEGLIALGLPMSDARAPGLIELGFAISDGAALGFAPSG